MSKFWTRGRAAPLADLWRNVAAGPRYGPMSMDSWRRLRPGVGGRGAALARVSGGRPRIPFVNSRWERLRGTSLTGFKEPLRHSREGHEIFFSSGRPRIQILDTPLVEESGPLS